MKSKVLTNSEKCKRYRERKRLGQVNRTLPLTNAEHCKRYRDRLKKRRIGESVNGGPLNVINNKRIKNNHAAGKIDVTPLDVCEAYLNMDQTYASVGCVKLEMNVRPHNTKGGMTEAVQSLSPDQVKQEDNSSEEELSFSESRNDEDSKSFQKEFIEGQQILSEEDFISSKNWKSDAVPSLFVHGVKLEDNCSAEELCFDEDSKSFQKKLIEGTREDFISPESWKSEAVHSLSIHEVKLEDNCSEDELSFQESRNDEQDSKIFQKEFIEGTRDDFILPKSLKSEAVHSMCVHEVKLEDNCSVEELSFQESRNNEEDTLEDTKSVLQEFMSDKDMEDRDFILPVSCGLRCDEKQLSEVMLPEYEHGEAIEETNVNISHQRGVKGHMCDEDSTTYERASEHHTYSSCTKINSTEQKKLLEPLINDVHKKLKNHKCQLCDYATTQNSFLKVHTKSVHLKVKNFKCHLCEHTTSQKSALKVHIDIVHLKLKDHKCQICDFATTSSGNLKKHMSSAHEKLKSHKCHLCEYSTSLKDSLKTHINCVHLKLKNHKCHMCEYTTTRKNTLNLHIKGVHLKLKNYKCHMCNYTALQKYNVVTHMQRLHPKT